MKRHFILLLVAIIALNTSAQTVEDNVLDELKLSFKEEGLNLKVLVKEYETVLIEKKILKDASVESWKKLLLNMCNRGVIAHVASYNLEIIDLEFQLSLQHLAVAVEEVKGEDEMIFSGSEINKFISRYPQSRSSTEPTLTYLYQTIDGATDALQKHDLYKHLLVLIVANFADVLDNSGDKILRSESDYARWQRSIGGNVPLFESRNICSAQINQENAITIRGTLVDSAQLIKPTLTDFLSYNRKLSKEETVEKIKNPSYEGFNFPFFSHISDVQINEKIEALNQQLDTVSNNDGLLKNLIWTRELWIRKKHYLQANGQSHLKEIHNHTHFELSVLGENQEKINELLVPMLEVMSELRNTECQAVFGESFAEVSKRNNFLLNDHFKLRYLENQFPLFILVNANQYLFPDGPPPQDAMPPSPPIRAGGKN